MIDLCAHAKRFPEGVCACWNDHEFLNIQPIGCVRAAVYNVHHRHGQRHRLRAAEKPVECDALRAGCRFCAGHGDSQRGVCAEDGHVLCAVERNQRVVDGGQIGGVHTAQRLVNGYGYIFAGAVNALAAVALHIVVTQLQRFISACRCAAGGNGCAGYAAGEAHFSLYGRVAAGIEHFPPDNADNLC